jgi:hypothetical protein
MQEAARDRSRRVYRNVAWTVAEVNQAERAVAAALLKHCSTVAEAMDAYTSWAQSTLASQLHDSESDDNGVLSSSLEEKPHSRSHGGAGGAGAVRVAGDSVSASPPRVLEAFVTARKLRRWLVQVRREVASDDDKIYEKLAPGIEERARMLFRLRPALLPATEATTAADPADDMLSGARDGDDGPAQRVPFAGTAAVHSPSAAALPGSPVAAAATVAADAVGTSVSFGAPVMVCDTTSIERHCMVFVTSHSLNMISLAKRLEWERVRGCAACLVSVCACIV